MKRKILVATTNPGKIAELKACLDADVEWCGLVDFDNLTEIKEDGTCFAENARKKALGYAKATSLWTIADDSGLVVDALNGAPGVNSARFSGPKGPDTNSAVHDRKNTAKVLKLLEAVPKDKRTARFICCLCLASPEKILIETKGTLEGLISDKPAGKNGFGYDPIFFLPYLNKTIAQLSAEGKNAISHRGCAISKLNRLLNELLRKTQG